MNTLKLFINIAFKDLLQWIVGLFLILQGVLVLKDYLELRKK
jgi:hypothetical protein